MKRSMSILVGLAALLSMGAEVRTTNFIVHAANPQVCQQVAQWAEHYRSEKAKQWVGQEMPTWPHPCPLHVTVTMGSPSGATSFQFGQGRVLGMKMEIQGPLDRVIHSVLPHEVTHTVFAHHFRAPVPRWADEGGSVLSEDDLERDNHDKLARSILNQGKQIRLRTLMGLTEYPPQVMCLYAQGYSMTDFLVKRSDKRTFLNFVGHGMQRGWDDAVKVYYKHNTVEELEGAWLQHLKDSKGQSHKEQILAQNQKLQPAQPQQQQQVAFVDNNNKNQRMVRLTVPPANPLEPQPIFRGSAPSMQDAGKRFGASQPQPNWQPSVRLDAPIPATGVPLSAYPASPQVQLGSPDFRR